MVNDGSQEARNPKSGFDTRSACRDDLDSACAKAGDDWEKAHTSCQLGSGGLGGYQLRHIGAEEAQKERSRGARSGVPVELELALSETQTQQGLEERDMQICCRAATERYLRTDPAHRDKFHSSHRRSERARATRATSHCIGLQRMQVLNGLRPNE